jgi:transcriptional regulator with XRE-family HTH domain
MMKRLTLREPKVSKTLYSAPQEILVSKLTAARMAAGFTQADVATRLRCHQSLIARIESGQRRIDVIEFLILARAIGFEHNTLLEQVGEAIPREARL